MAYRAINVRITDCEQSVSDERDGLYRRMGGERLHAISPEGVDARVGPNVGAIAAETAQFDIVSVWFSPTRKTPMSSCCANPARSQEHMSAFYVLITVVLGAIDTRLVGIDSRIKLLEDHFQSAIVAPIASRPTPLLPAGRG